MNKTMITMAIGLFAFFVNAGLGLRVKSTDINEQRRKIVSENVTLENEINAKQGFKKIRPIAISSAWTSFVNEAKMFETYSGTQMDIDFGGHKENENIEDYFVGTAFRRVKGLPIVINVEKYSNQTDMAEVLNDIYLLENRTDFKVSEISTDSNALIVKGELYGI